MNLRVSGGGRKRAEEREGEEGGEEGEEEEGGMGMEQCILTRRGRIADFHSTNPLEQREGGELRELHVYTRLATRPRVDVENPRRMLVRSVVGLKAAADCDLNELLV